MWSTASVAGRFAREALSRGPGEVCAVFRRSFYLRLPGERYACVGDASLGRGPLNALVADFRAPALGQRISVSVKNSRSWQPPAHQGISFNARPGRVPAEGLGCLILGRQNALSVHAQPALEALDRWLAGNALASRAASLIGLGPGLTPSGDDYLAGMLVALRSMGRGADADSLWRWLEPCLKERTSPISAAHLAAAASGEVHEALHEVLNGSPQLEKLDAIGHCSGWDALAGAVAVLRSS